MTTKSDYLTYKELQACTEKYQETNDCTVKALSQVCSISYEKAHNILRMMGRKGRKGTSMENVKSAVRGLGHEVSLSKVWGKTIGNSFIPRNKIFLIETSCHVIAAREGKALDYTEGGRHRILTVWEVTPASEKALTRFTEVKEQVLYVPRAKVQAKWKYTCQHGCEHEFTTTRHNKSQRGFGYRCKKHKASLTYGKQSATPQPSGLPSWIKIKEY